ncbi:MAG: copper chaperone NosL [Nonlabens sp.]|jgi:copper chaperone NosL
MRSLFKVAFVVLPLLLLLACNTGPQAIDYGNDGCQYCKMTIVDKIHGAELITDKGKVYKFDAAECMINYVNENKKSEIGSLLTNYHEEPTFFITNREASFLISENLPSPMGAYLTAFKSKAKAEEMLAEKGGTIYTWNELNTYLNK